MPSLKPKKASSRPPPNSMSELSPGPADARFPYSLRYVYQHAVPEGVGAAVAVDQVGSLEHGVSLGCWVKVGG
jgi:hypothetical protein